MTIIAWEAPPERPSLGRVSKWDPIMVELRAHPGQWAKLVEAADNKKASSQRQALAKKYPDITFAARGTAVYGTFPAPPAPPAA